MHRHHCVRRLLRGKNKAPLRVRGEREIAVAVDQPAVDDLAGLPNTTSNAAPAAGEPSASRTQPAVGGPGWS
jgi:hypothetical protein